MGAVEIRLPAGLTTLRSNYSADLLTLGISVTAAPGQEMIAPLDRGQAHLLMLYLQDKLGYHGLRRVACPECGMDDPPHHKPGCNFGAAVAK